ncbi:MAG: OmpA family protein [Deltaproteobacteria bacterium]|nr:OmpA family protein [Deltaproteobacteria bacterium]
MSKTLKLFFSYLLLSFGFLTCLWTSAQALTTSFSVNTFTPTIDDSAFFTVYDSPTMLKRNYHVGFYLDYANKPYEFGDAGFNRVGGVVDHLLSGNIVGSYGILDWFTAGLVMPIHFYEGINSPLLGLDENNIATGDVQLTFKFRLLNRDTTTGGESPIGLALVPFVSFPTSTNSGDFLGNGSFSGGAKLVLDAQLGKRVDLALNLGYLTRDRVFDVGNNDLDDQFLASLGLSVEVFKKMKEVSEGWYEVKGKGTIIAEAQAATVTRDFFSARRTTPAEARLGFRYTWHNNHDLNIGGGLGVSNGIGNPRFRAFAGYTYTKRPLAEMAVDNEIPEFTVKPGDELTLQDKIYFEFDKADIREISKSTLDKIAGFLNAHPQITKIRIEGYTCDLGSNAYNQKLSDRRANSVADYMRGQGVDPNRIGLVEGYGETNFLVPNVDEPSREQNRRVQIFVESVDNSLAP